MSLSLDWWDSLKCKVNDQQKINKHISAIYMQLHARATV